MKEIQTPKSYI